MTLFLISFFKFKNPQYWVREESPRAKSLQIIYNDIFERYENELKNIIDASTKERLKDSIAEYREEEGGKELDTLFDDLLLWIDS